MGCAGIAALVFLPIGIVLSVASSSTASIGFTFILGALITGGYWLYHWLARRRLGGVPTVTFDKPEVEAGGTLAVRVGFTPPADTVMERATAECRCTEVVVRGSGTDKQTFRHAVLADQEEMVAAGTRLLGGTRGRVGRAVRDPARRGPVLCGARQRSAVERRLDD